MANFLYHSFPRARQENENLIPKSVLILESIIKSGLLLTPERICFSEELENGMPGNENAICQRRICFTNILQEELEKKLPNHAKHFGPITLEFDINKLRLANICPVFYVPYDIKENIWTGAIGAILARGAETQELLNRLNNLKELIKNNEDLNQRIDFTENDKVVKNTNITIGNAKDLLSFLESKSQPIDQQLNSFKVLSNLFYPIENSKHNPELGYYRQNEWRIFSGMIKNSMPLIEKATDSEKATLISIDKDFFNKKIKFPKEEYSIVNNCEFLRKINNEPIVKSISRIFAEENAIEEITALLKKNEIRIEVVKIKTVS